MQPLSRSAMCHLASRFALYDHHPPQPQLEALQDLLEKLDEMAQGTLEPAYHVSSLDPGVGKTLAVCAYLRVLLASPEHGSVGVLLGIQRLSEIDDLVSACGLPKSSFAVLTANEELNRLGSSQVNEAQVLFTTQSRLHRHFRLGSFCTASAFFYRGKPRQIRIWDETLMPGRGLCLSRDKLLGIFDKVRSEFPEQVDRLDDLLMSLKTRVDGELIDLEDLQSSFGMDLGTVLTEGRWLGSETRDLLQCLIVAGGQTVRIRKPPNTGSLYLVTGVDALPCDFAPVVILDASARVRYGYRLWETRRKGVRLLKEAPKSYEGLTVHYWARGAGQTKLRKDAQVILPAVASAIRDELSPRPEVKWLVVCRKPKGGDIDLERRLSAMLPIEMRARVSFLTWGQHTATNAHSDCTHAMLIGGLYPEDHHYEAQCLAIGGYEATQPISPEMRDAFAQGEKLHDILQAACRIGIRKGSSVKGKYHVYLIAARHHGLAEKLEEVFPGCHLVDWQPERKLSGHKQRTLVDFVIRELPADSSRTLFNKQIWAHLDIHRNALTQLRNHPAVLAALEVAGIEKAIRGGKCVGYQRKHASAGPDRRPPVGAAKALA